MTLVKSSEVGCIAGDERRHSAMQLDAAARTTVTSLGVHPFRSIALDAFDSTLDLPGFGSRVPILLEGYRTRQDLRSRVSGWVRWDQSLGLKTRV